ncbi:MAG: NAD(P)/FAD-dependent oxidoreductase [Solirubrobacterales bacterium]
MSEEVDVLIVGGGSFGLNTANHLNQLGIETRVVERDRLAGATTTCGAGFVGFFSAGLAANWGPEEVALESYAIDYYTHLYEKIGGYSFRNPGMLFLATNQEAWSGRMKPIIDYAEKIPGAEVLDPAGVAKRGEIVDADHVVGGVYHPQAIQMVTGEALLALGERLREEGVQVDERLEVSGLDVSDGRIRGVETEDGPIRARRVVLATAMWTNTLLRGHADPVANAPLGVVRINTEPLGLPETMPMIMVPEEDVWIRQEAGALRFGARYGGNHRDAMLDIDPPAQIKEMPMDGIRQVEKIAEQLAPAIPPLRQYKEFDYIEGYPCYTPDQLPILGPIDGVEGLYVFTGDAECGITHGPGGGRELARMLAGEPAEIDITRYRPNRFDQVWPSARGVAEELRSRRPEIELTTG